MNTTTLRAIACTVFLIASPAVAGRPGGGGHSGGSHSHSSYSHRSPGEHSVRGYTRKNGTYVAPHYQTNPDATRNDNYSTRGNINPHTGVEGTKPRDGEVPSR